MRLHTRTSDDAHRLGFVKRHLHEMLRLASSHPAALLATPTALASLESGGAKTLQQQANVRILLFCCRRCRRCCCWLLRCCCYCCDLYSLQSNKGIVNVALYILHVPIGNNFWSPFCCGLSCALVEPWCRIPFCPVLLEFP